MAGQRLLRSRRREKELVLWAIWQLFRRRFGRSAQASCLVKRDVASDKNELSCSSAANRALADWPSGRNAGSGGPYLSQRRAVLGGYRRHALHGILDEWLAATAANPDGSAVRFSSCFPFIGKTDLVVPPRTVWPPPSSAKTRWKGAHFVPVSVVQALLAGEAMNEEAWSVDGPSECLVPSGKQGPFRIGVRNAAAVDRLTGIPVPMPRPVSIQPGAGFGASSMRIHDGTGR